MIPPAAAIHIRPMLDLARLGDQQADPVGVHRVCTLPVDLDDPREVLHDLRTVRRALAVRTARIPVTAPELDNPRAYRRNDRDLLGQHRRHHAAIGVGRVERAPQHIVAWHRSRNPELEDGPDQRIDVVASQCLGERHRPIGLFAIGLLQPVDEIKPVADAKIREIDHDVVALAAALLVQLRQSQRIDDQVSVVGDELERHRTAARIRDGQLEKPRHGRVQQPEAVLARQDLHEWRIGKVHQRHIADEPIRRENVEEILPLGVGCSIRDDEIHVEIGIAVGQLRPARQTQVDPIREILPPAIARRIHVHLHEIALVDILGGEEEPVVMGPQCALQLAEVAGDLDDAVAVVGSSRKRVCRVGVDLVAPGERRAPAVIIERAREMVHVGRAVALGPVMRVVEMKLRLVAPKPVVLSPVERSVIINPVQDRLAIAQLQQHRRHRALRPLSRPVGPHRVRVLVRQPIVELGARLARTPRTHIANLGKKLVPPLMREHFSRRPSLHRSPVRDGVAEWIIENGNALILLRRKVGVIRQPLRRRLFHVGGKIGIRLPVHDARRERYWRLSAQPVHTLRELLDAKQRRPRHTGRSARYRTAHVWAKPVLGNQQTARREDPPPDQIALGDLTQR